MTIEANFKVECLENVRVGPEQYFESSIKTILDTMMVRVSSLTVNGFRFRSSIRTISINQKKLTRQTDPLAMYNELSVLCTGLRDIWNSLIT